MNRPLPSISFFTLLFFVHLPVSYAQDDANIRQCFQPFSCGNIANLVFPFWSESSPEFCRIEGFGLTKCDDDQPVINIGVTEFRLVFVDQPNGRITIAREDLWDTICISPPITNLTLGNHLLRFSPANRNLTFFYGCGSSVAPPRDRARFECSAGSFSLYADDNTDGNSYQQFRRLCPDGAIHVQVNQSDFQRQGGGNFESGTWRVGFDVEYNYAEIFCGKCNGDRSLCNNPTSSQYPVCPNPGGGFTFSRKPIIGICGAAGGILISCVGIVCFRRRTTTTFLGKFTNKDQDIEAFLRNNGTLAPKRYTYSDVKRMTDSFKEKLGKGGRKNLDVGVHESSEIYFPHWIHRNLEQDNIGPEMLGLLSKEEAEIARKMIIVGLWCIQTNPKDRPSISTVKDMLETKEALQIPPKP
ncbi:hypothetical protein GQ457_16G024640 [Hibiscus cannabinus]